MKEPFFIAKNISKKFSKDSKLIFPLEFYLKYPHNYALLGPSGAGKTTFAKLLSALVKPTFGSLTFQGKKLTKPVKAIQYVHQHPIYSFTPHHRLSLSFAALKNLNPFFFHQALNSLNLSNDILERYPEQLSGGEGQRLALVRALLVRPKILICDEVTANLDPMNKNALIDFIKNAQSTHPFTLIWISHDLEEVYSLAQTAFLFQERKITKQLLLSCTNKAEIKRTFEQLLYE